MAQKRKRTHIMQAEADRETLEYIRRHRPFLNSFSDVYSLAIFELGAKITIEESDKKDRQQCARCGNWKKSIVTHNDIAYCHNCYEMLGHAGFIDVFAETGE